MSIEATNWAWGQSIKPNVKLILLAIADRADRGGSSWPSVSRLSKDTGLDERSIYRHIKALSDAGLVSVIPDNGKGNTYRLNFDVQKKVVVQSAQPLTKCHPTPDSTVTPDKLSPLTECQGTPDKNDSGPLTKYHPTPDSTVNHIIIEPKEEPKENPKNFRRDEEDLDAPNPASSSESVYELPLRSKANGKPKTFPISREHFTAWQEAYPLVDVRSELKTIKAWLVSNPGKRPASDMLRFVNTWLKRGQNDKSRQEARASPPRQPVRSFQQQAQESVFDEFRHLAAMEERHGTEAF